jgi:hypothetical protein
LRPALPHRAAEEARGEDVDHVRALEVLRLDRHQAIDLATRIERFMSAPQDLQYVVTVEHVQNVLDHDDVEAIELREPDDLACLTLSLR